jgi:hypothetical protein
VKNVITDARGITEASPAHLCSIFISSVDIPYNINPNFSDYLNVPSISDSDVKQAIRRLRSLKRADGDGISSLIMNVAQYF